MTTPNPSATCPKCGQVDGRHTCVMPRYAGAGGVKMAAAGYDLQSLNFVFCEDCGVWLGSSVNPPGAETWCATCIRGYHKEVVFPAE